MSTRIGATALLLLALTCTAASEGNRLARRLLQTGCISPVFPFGYTLDTAASEEFIVQCQNGQLYLPSLDLPITSFGRKYFTTSKPLYQRACGNKTDLSTILNLTESFALSSANILEVNGTRGRGLLADSMGEMFPYRSQAAVVGREFRGEVTLAGWGDCGGTYLRGPSGQCWWDASTNPPQGGSCEVQISFIIPSPPEGCTAPPKPFGFTLDTAASPEFLVACQPGNKLLLTSIDVIIASFGDGYITTDKPFYQLACDMRSDVNDILKLTPSFRLAADNILATNGTEAHALLADSVGNMIPFRTTSAIGIEFAEDVTLASVGNCGGGYLVGPQGSCSWDATTAAPVGECDVKIVYDEPSPPNPSECAIPPFPFGMDLDTAASPEFLVRCVEGDLMLTSINTVITSFGNGFFTTSKAMYSLSCGMKTNTVDILNLTPSFRLAADNMLVISGKEAHALVADSTQQAFPFRSKAAALGMEFAAGVYLNAWGNCGGGYLVGPTGQCSWDGTDSEPIGSCDVKITYTIPNPTPVCDAPPAPFGYTLATAASADFLVQCMPGNQLWLPSINVIISKFGDGYINTNKPLYKRACGAKTELHSILNLTEAFTLSPDNYLNVNGTDARGLLADSEGHMFPYGDGLTPTGVDFQGEITLAGWGNCGGAFVKGPEADCWWDGSEAPPTGSCEVKIKYTVPTPAPSCPPPVYPFGYTLETAASTEFLVSCNAATKQLILYSLNAPITSFKNGSITVDVSVYARSCSLQSFVSSPLALTPAFRLSGENVLEITGNLGAALVADTAGNAFPYRAFSGPLQTSFGDSVFVYAWGDCVGAYLVGPSGQCTWDGVSSPAPNASCDLLLDYALA